MDKVRMPQADVLQHARIGQRVEGDANTAPEEQSIKAPPVLTRYNNLRSWGRADTNPVDVAPANLMPTKDAFGAYADEVNRNLVDVHAGAD
jgi:hypothetical protein